MNDKIPLFAPFTLRSLAIRNRIGVSPMCQYSSADGFANDWHLVHLGARATGGAGMVMAEATGVTPEGRISPGCLGIWKDDHIEFLKRITDFVIGQDSTIGIQLAHAGRKGSVATPQNGGKPLLNQKDGGWQTIAPSAISFADGYTLPKTMTVDDIRQNKDAFVAAARRAVMAGFQIIEIHGAHGYLIHEFLSPLSNKRDDDYGGTEENRFRLMLEIAEAIRAEIPANIVLGARLSCTDWAEGGLTIDDTSRLSAQLKNKGVDFIDCSSGFVTLDAKVPFAPNFQVPFAAKIRADAKIPTCAVGLITKADQANDIIKNGEADMVFLARAMLYDPSWALHAAKELKTMPPVPIQYARGYA